MADELPFFPGGPPGNFIGDRQDVRTKRIMKHRENIAEIKILDVMNAGPVAFLERNFFPENQRNGWFKIKGFILNNKRYQSDLSLGLFVESDLVGYHLAYPIGFRNTIQSKHEKRVYLSDFAIIPEYRGYANEMQGRALSSARKIFPSRPLITDAFEYYKDKWIKREAFFKAHGYVLIQCKRLENTRFDKDIFRLRWVPAGTGLHTEKDEYPFHMGPHIVHYLFQFYRLVSKKMGLNGLHV